MGAVKSSGRKLAAPSLKTGAAIGFAAFMAACATAPAPGPAAPGPGGPTAEPSPVLPPPAPPTATVEGITPPFMASRQIVRVGLLLPFSLRPQDAAALYNAAELALFDHGNQNTLLIPRDAGSDEASASAAARALVNEDGADIIIGPVLREGVAGAGNVARGQNVPVIGFSSDRDVAGNGVYLLSFQLEDEVARIVSYAASQNIRTIALLAPSNEYGRRIESALRAEAASSGVTIVTSQLYNRTDADATAAANALAATLQTSPAQGIIIADNGGPLRAIGTALVQRGVNQSSTRFMGTSVWAGDAQREPSLAGGWYVAPDPGARTDFEARYQATFGQAPTRLSSLGYDAVALAALLSRDAGPRGFSRSAIENGEGFAGSDGLFRFRSTGAIERGLAIIEVRPNEVTILEAAPRRFPRSS
jgi:branched-chain amino acid transport system substrate-binding protein